MNSFQVDSNILLAIKMLEDKGHKAYLVGGIVRDYVLDTVGSDYDIATSATLEEAQEVFREYKQKKYIGKGITLGVVINHTHFELSTFKGQDIYEDLRNRDFTMNSMAWNPREELLDPYNGIYDMSKHSLNTVRDPDEVFIEDPVRILRAIRFSVTKAMEPSTKLFEAIERNKDLLKDIKKERIRKELEPVLLSEKPSKYLEKYQSIFLVLFPDLIPMVGFDQKNPYWHHLDVFHHTLAVVDATKPILELRMAALLHDIGKPDTFTIDQKGVGHFYGHPHISAKYADQILLRLCYSHIFIQRVCHIIEYHDYPLNVTMKSAEHFLYSFGTQDLDLYFGLRRADTLGQNPERLENLYLIDDFTALVKQVLDEGRIITLRNLAIKGNDLLELGYADEMIGKALEIILKKVIAKQLKNNYDKLYAFAAELKYHINEQE